MIKRFLIVTMMIGVFACGGSQRGESTPTTATATGGDPASAGSGQPSGEAGGRKPSDAGEFAINQADKSSRPKQAKLQATDAVRKEPGLGINLGT